MTPKRLALDVVGVLASGTMLTAALPLGERAFLAWVALVPLLVAFRGRGLLIGFLAGAATALFAAFLASESWLYAHRAPGSPLQIYATYATYTFSFALTVAIWGEPRERRLSAPAFAALATLLEAVLLLAIPAHLALTQYRHAFWVQAAALGGIWLVSFAVWWTNFALAELLVTRKRNLILVLPALALPLGHAWLPADGPTERFAAVQLRHRNPAALRRLQAQATAARATLVVWPELAGNAFAPEGDRADLRSVGGAPFVTSFDDRARPLPHNVAALFTGHDESARCAKRKLFGDETRFHAPGHSAVAVGGIGLNVCFDSCFPAIVRETAGLGVRVVALPTIDPASTNDFVAAMHTAYSPFRAAENGVAIVRANGGAFSSIVDARGRIVAERASGDGVLVGDATVGPRPTPARTVGDGFLLVCAALLTRGVAQTRKPDGSTEDEEDA